MISDRERREADRFYADLMGPRRPGRMSWRGAVEEADGWPDLRSGLVVFYDEDTLRFIEGWTRDTHADEIILINRSRFDPIRNDARQRSRAYDDYLRRSVGGARNLMPPLFVMEPSLHTAPLLPRAPGDWDDLMISRLKAGGRALAVQSEAEQWKLFLQMLDKAELAAQGASPSQPAKECVAYLVLDNVRATLRAIEATNVTMSNDHVASIPLFHSTTSSGVRFAFRPGGDRGDRVIGDLHTHALLDPDARSNAAVTRVGRRVIAGVSDVDGDSASTERFVVYAIDSHYLHRANPDGSTNNKLERKGNVLREALRIFGGEPPRPQ
jgi:hypothetical protein